ncbi:hypothetical protein VTK56DRAFT_1231 [Thermocarpiscus australiensis]
MASNGDVLVATSPELPKLDGPRTAGGLEDDEAYPDAMGQFPYLDGYTQACIGFEVPAETSRAAIETTVRDAVAKLTTLIPWLGHQVAPVPGRNGGPATLTTVPWPADSDHLEVQVKVKSCDDLMATMPELLRADAPIRMLPGEVLGPWPALPHPHSLTGPVPVTAVQINLVRGGVLLTLLVHHIIIDGTGFVQIARMLATLLDGGEIAPEDIAQANRDRARVVPLIPRGEPLKDFSHLRRPHPGWAPPPPASPPTWCYFKLPVASLAALTRSAADSPIRLSRDDIICAFYWQRISACRLARGMAPDTVTKFGRAVDGRGALGVPFTYLGHMVYHCAVYRPLEQVAGQPLSAVAQALRRELAAANTAWAVRSFATFMTREPDKSALLYGGRHDPNTDLGASSAIVAAADAKEAASALPSYWGPLLGRTKFIRRPRVMPVPGALIIHPVESGAVPLLVGLPQDDLEALKQDRVWRQYTRYVG